jgi:hypothetical protein
MFDIVIIALQSSNEAVMLVDPKVALILREMWRYFYLSFLLTFSGAPYFLTRSKINEWTYLLQTYWRCQDGDISTSISNFVSKKREYDIMDIR